MLRSNALMSVHTHWGASRAWGSMVQLVRGVRKASTVRRARVARKLETSANTKWGALQSLGWDGKGSKGGREGKKGRVVRIS